MNKLKTKVVEGLPLNYNSTDSKDFVEVLNKIADAMGGVRNMGVFADITSITQSSEMIAKVEDKYVAANTKRYEKPHHNLVVTTNVSEPYQFDLDTLVGKKGTNISSDLEIFLSQTGNPEPSQTLSSSNSRHSIAPSNTNDVKNNNWDDKEEDDEDEEENEEDEMNDEDESLKDAFKDVGNEMSSVFKETASVFKDTFKFK